MVDCAGCGSKPAAGCRSGIWIPERFNTLLGASVEQVGRAVNSIRDRFAVSLQARSDQRRIIAKLLRKFASIVGVHAHDASLSFPQSSQVATVVLLRLESVNAANRKQAGSIADGCLYDPH